MLYNLPHHREIPKTRPPTFRQNVNDEITHLSCMSFHWKRDLIRQHFPNFFGHRCNTNVQLLASPSCWTATCDAFSELWGVRFCFAICCYSLQQPVSLCWMYGHLSFPYIVIVNLRVNVSQEKFILRKYRLCGYQHFASSTPLEKMIPDRCFWRGRDSMGASPKNFTR